AVDGVVVERFLSLFDARLPGELVADLRRAVESRVVAGAAPDHVELASALVGLALVGLFLAQRSAYAGLLPRLLRQHVRCARRREPDTEDGGRERGMPRPPSLSFTV